MSASKQWFPDYFNHHFHLTQFFVRKFTVGNFIFYRISCFRYHKIMKLVSTKYILQQIQNYCEDLYQEAAKKINKLFCLFYHKFDSSYMSSMTSDSFCLCVIDSSSTKEFREMAIFDRYICCCFTIYFINLFMYRSI